MFNLGVGLVDGLCDGDPQLGLRLLHEIQGLDLSGAARERPPGDRLRLALPASLAADPGAAFTARIIGAFFALLHSTYPGGEGSALRDHVGALLQEALEAECQSVDRVGVTARDRLIECSRRTSVVPFQIIEHLAAGDPALPEPTAGALLGEAIWRIDDLVDLTQDAELGALNAVLLAAAKGPRPAAARTDDADLARVLRSRAIPNAAAQAAEYLDAGLKAAPGGTAESEDQLLFLSFVHRYGGDAQPPRLLFRLHPTT